METVRWRRRCLLLCSNLIMRWISHLASNGGGLWPLTLQKHYFHSRKATVSGWSRGRYCQRISTSYSPSGSQIQGLGRFLISGVRRCKSVDCPSNSGSGHLPFDFCVIWRMLRSTTRFLLWKSCCSRVACSQMSALETRVLMTTTKRCDQVQGTEPRW